MNPLLVEALGAIVRAGLNVCAGWFVAHGIWAANDAEKYVGSAALVVLSIGWSLFQKYGMRIKLLTALATPQTMSENEVQRMVKDPTVNTPPVTLQKHEEPRSMEGPDAS